MATNLNIFALKYWAEKIRLSKSAGQLERLSSLLAKSSIDLNPHQIHATVFAFNSPLSRGAILADEVGLGKTIEAGIIISQLWLEDKKRILIVVPASLRTQWQDELETHFGLSSTVLDTPSFLKEVDSGNPTPLTTEGIFITSLPFVCNRIKLVEKQPWDLIVVDEAHKLRRVYRGKDASKMAYALRGAIKDKPKLLLTATPLQNNLLELYGLVSFIDDKLLGSKYFFKTRFVDKITQNSSKSNSALVELRKLVVGPEDQDFFSPSGVLVRTLRKQVKGSIKFPLRKSNTQDFTPSDEEYALYEKVSEYLKRQRIAAIQATQRNLMILVYRKLLASSSFAIAPTLKKLFERLERELKLRKIEKESKFAEIKGDKAKSEIRESSEELENLEKDMESKGRVPQDFTDEEIQKEIKELKEYYQSARSIKINVKGEALVSALKNIFKMAGKKGFPEKALVFTESRRTQNYLEKVFKANNIAFTSFNGSNSSKEARKAYESWRKEFPEHALNLSRKVAVRQALIHEFKTKTQVLVSTEAGAEGLNLQFCNIIVNYDLPWNPQRVEQRIGRAHRYGQKHEVIVINMLNTKNYADKRVLELMQEKLHLFDGLFGASDEILGVIESGVGFEKRIVDIYQTCKTPKQIDKAFVDMQKDMEFELSSKIKKVRTQIIEQFDAPILKLFKKTKIELSKVLSEYDESLLKLCMLYFREDIKATKDPGKYSIKYDGKKKGYLFRKEKEEEIGKISRVHNDHPIIMHIIDKADSSSTDPIPTVKINYSKSQSKIKGLEKYLNKEGYIFLFKLMVRGVEEDEALTPLVFVKNGENYKAIPYDFSRFIVELDSEMMKETTAKSPISKEVLLSVWEKWRKDAVAKYESRNEKLYIREEERISRFWNTQSLSTKDKIEKTEPEIKDLIRKKYNTIDFDHKRQLSQKIQKAEIKLQRLKIKQTQEEAEALRGKQKDIRELNKKLKPDMTEELIAITKFMLV